MAALADTQNELKDIYRRKWAQEILFALQRAPRRYTDIQCDVTVATGKPLHSHTLNTTLKWLQAQGYIQHHRQGDGADYRLTVDGADLARVLAEIYDLYGRRRQRRD